MPLKIQGIIRLLKKVCCHTIKQCFFRKMTNVIVQCYRVSAPMLTLTVLSTEQLQLKATWDHQDKNKKTLDLV